MHDLDLISVFRPVGSFLARRFTRRSFIGACISLPIAPVLLGVPSDSMGASLNPTDNNFTLRFTENAEALNVTWYPSLEGLSDRENDSTSSEASHPDATVKNNRNSEARTWRIARKAFGPDAKFSLRRLAVEPELKYQLKVENVRFGELKPSSHWFTFTHDSKKRNWVVRLRTDLWSAPRHLRSDEKGIPFELLAHRFSDETAPLAIDFKSNSISADQAREGFCIDTDASVVKTSMQGVFEDYVQVEGPLRLTLAKDGVWFLTSRSENPKNARNQIRLADGALIASSGVCIAWCTPVDGDGPRTTDPWGNRSPEKDPIFVAWSGIEAGAKPILLGNGDGSNVKLELLRNIVEGSPDEGIRSQPAKADAPKPSDTSMAAQEAAGNTGETVPTDATQKLPPVRMCKANGERSLMDRQDGVVAFVKECQIGPQWRYVRRDWTVVNGHPAGISTVHASWLAHATMTGESTVFGPLCVHEGVLQQSRSFDPRLKFAGRLDEKPWWLKSRIGWLRTHGWSADASKIEPAHANARTHHPLMTVESSGFGRTLISLDVPLLLLESELAPSGCDFSKLTFAPTGLRVVYNSDAPKVRSDLRASDSYLWLGKVEDIGDLPLAHIDLTRGRLEVARTNDLARLAFTFAGLNLDIVARGAWVTDARASCRVRQRVAPGTESDPLVLDSRPVLVVEFPPQHVFEEAIFRPGIAPLPDVRINKPTTFPVKIDGKEKVFSTSLPTLLLQLKDEKKEEDRIVIRKAYANLKATSESFKTFSQRFKDIFNNPGWKAKWPSEEHHIYIGALGLPPDLAAEARKINVELRTESLPALLTKTLDDADRIVRVLDSSEPSTDGFLEWARQKLNEIWDLSPASKGPNQILPREKARLIEQVVSGVMQGYADFRDFFAEQMVLRQGKGDYRRDDFEYFSKSNRPDELELSKEYPTWEGDIRKDYLKVLGGTQEPEKVMRARLSGPSRLAFHIDCGSGSGIDVEDNEAHFSSLRRTGSRRNSGPGTRLPFSFEALTDWRHYDLAVTPRARQAAVFDDAGVLIRRDITEAGLDDDTSGADIAMLKSLGIRSGQVATRSQGPGSSRDWGKSLRTIQERLADVEASLRVAPDELQTAIELPARLILSPSQKAQWRTPGQLCADRNRPVPLWSATLATATANPQVRAVASPDMRPEFVRYGLERNLLAANTSSAHSPVGAAPPRGPRAPWTLGFEESDPNVTLEKLYQATAPDKPPIPPSAADICGPLRLNPDSPAKLLSVAGVPEVPASGKQDLHPVVEYLCQRVRERSAYGKDAVFRSTLDAYDRHEIVLLSSAWGLPVRGRREKSGELQVVRLSSQVELPAEWRLLDVEKGTSVYRPRALKVRELTLSALGGSLRHDSDFVPPAAARHILHGPLFDSMSLERWQHWTVLGRDVFSEVIYKGYLFPFGHCASLVKETERVFLRPAGGGQVRAYLRQRMFIRVARPEKAFPAFGQPHGGRKFPGGVVNLLTLTTPDIVDPTEDTEKLDVPTPSGRLFANEAGLVFWPRTARFDGAEVEFDMQVQGAATQARLIFVDNVAANRAELMDKLVDYYNNHQTSPDKCTSQNDELVPLEPLRHLRTLDLRGQTLRYCDEIRPGSASHKTLAWTLKATGCTGVTPSLNKTNQRIDPWEGLVERYDDPMLEGVDQPPFFPAIETARIRIDQVERLTNGAPRTVVAQFDGWYLKNGFEADRITGDRDSLEIYLNIVSKLTMDMGSNGDRSGGVMRPAGRVIALSRQRGPLNGQLDKDPMCGKTYSVTGADGFPISPPTSQNGGAKNASGGSEERTKTAFKKFFKKGEGLDTKILGLVSISELLEHFNVREAASDLPCLRDAVEYGVGGIESAAAVIRTEVILPLNDVVKALASQWKKVGAEAKSSLPRGLEEVFPEVDGALNDLLAVLGKSSRNSDDLALFASLGDVYECGRRLMDACGRVAANPIDQLQLAANKKLQGLGNSVERLTQGLDVQVTEPFISSITSPETAQGLLGGAFDWLTSIVVVMEKLRTEVEKHESILAAFDNSLYQLKTQLPSIESLRTKVEASINSKGDKAPLDVARNIVDERLSAIETWLTDAKSRLNLLPGPMTPDNVLGALYTAREVLETSKNGVSKARMVLKGSSQINDDSEYRTMVQTIAKILEIATMFKEVESNPKTLLALFSQALSEYARLLVGPRLAKLPRLSEVKDLARTVLDPIKDIAEKEVELIADPLKPTNTELPPQVNGEFALPKNWSVPGGNRSLVNGIHEVAKAVDKVLERARQSGKEADAIDEKSRILLTMLGHHALKAERQLHQATIAFKLTGNAISDFDEVRVQASMHQADVAYRALELLGASMVVILQQLAKDIAAITIIKVIEQVEPPVRAVIQNALQWLMDGNEKMKKRLEEFGTKFPDWAILLGPWRSLADTYDSKIKDAFRFASDNNPDWLKNLSLELENFPTPSEAASETGTTAVVLWQRMVSEQVFVWVSTMSTPSQATTDALLSVFRPLVNPLTKIYTDLLTARNAAYQATIGTPAEWVNDALLVTADSSLTFKVSEKHKNTPKTESDQLCLDKESLEKLSKIEGSMSPADRTQAVRFLEYFLMGWRTGQSTPLRIANQVQRISLDEIRSKLMALINFSAIREEIEERIKLLIPTAATLSYDFSTTIGSGAGDNQVFKPKDGCLLRVNSRARVDLLNQTTAPSFHSEGELGAFDVEILPSHKALTLHFKGVRFTSDGGTPECDLQYDGFEIGPELKFLEQLTPFFGSKAGSGFYLKPLSSGVGLEAGYGLNLGTFSVGNLAIFNVSLNAAARLPFDNRGATFVASLSRRDSPFTIAIAPYGGSGFFALEADTNGIVGFEVSFEYGGAGAFKYGPLHGQGRLMVGAYIRSKRNERPEIFATFYVGGSASIWIFNFGASLYVNATQDKNSGNMVGSATYSFSFSMGIVDFDYQVAVNVDLPLDGTEKKSEEKQLGRKLKNVALEAPVRLAAIEPGDFYTGATTSDVPLRLFSVESSRVSMTRAKAGTFRHPFRKVQTVCPSSNWRDYSRYFDMSLKVSLEEY